jgi:hypothetical protein
VWSRASANTTRLMCCMVVIMRALPVGSDAGSEVGR